MFSKGIKALALVLTVAAFWSCKDDERSLVSIDDYFASHSLEGFTTTDSGLRYKVTTEGSGDPLESTDVVVSNVIISNLNDQILFDSQIQGEWHASLDSTSQLIEGMLEAYFIIPVGGVITAFVPSELAFGADGIPGTVAPNEDLKLEVEHLRVKQTIPEYIAAKELGEFEVTESGLYYQVLNEGEGDLATTTQVVTMHYTGYLFNDTEFDSSIGSAPLASVVGAGDRIAGWAEAMELFNEGTEAIIIMPHYLGYGASGAGSTIPPYEPLRFDIEIIDIQ